MLDSISESNLIMAAGGAGGRGRNQITDLNKINFLGNGGGFVASASVYSQPGTQSSGYRKGRGEDGYTGGAGGGGYWGGTQSRSVQYGGGGGSAYINMDVVNVPYNTGVKEYGSNTGGGYCKIRFDGQIWSTFRITTDGHSKINGQDEYEVRGLYGTTITVPPITDIAQYLEVQNIQQISGDGTLSGSQFTFGQRDSNYVVTYKGGNVNFQAVQRANQPNIVDVSVTSYGKEYSAEKKLAGQDWMEIGADGEAWDSGKYPAPSTYGYVGKYGQPYTVNMPGLYNIYILGAGGGTDGGCFGGGGASVSFDMYFDKGETFYLHVARHGRDCPFVNGGKDPDDYGCKGWLWEHDHASISGNPDVYNPYQGGGFGIASGGGGGASGVQLDGYQFVKAAGGGGGENDGPGYGGRRSTDWVGGTITSSGRGQDSTESSMEDDKDASGGGGGWYGGIGAPGQYGFHAYGGQSGKAHGDFSVRYSGGGGGVHKYMLIPNTNSHGMTETAGTNGEYQAANRDGVAIVTPKKVHLTYPAGGNGWSVKILDKASPNKPEGSDYTKQTIDTVYVRFITSSDNGSINSFRCTSWDATADNMSSETVGPIPIQYISGFDHFNWSLSTGQSGTSTIEDYTFGKYARGTDCTVRAVDKEGNIGESVTFHIPNAIDIVYDKNDTTYNIYNEKCSTTATGTQDTEFCVEGEEHGISGCSYNKEGYQFKEWNSKSDGTGETILPGDILTYEELVDIGGKLYAIWEPIVYKVEYHGNENFNTEQTVYTEEQRFDHEFTLLPTRYNRNVPYTYNGLDIAEGYRFIGWGNTPTQNTVDYLDEQKVVNLKNEENTVYVMNAIWQKDLTLTLSMNGGQYKGNGSDVLLKGSIWNKQRIYEFNIADNLNAGNEPLWNKQTNQLDGYGEVRENGLNTLYTKYEKGVRYRFIGWSLKADADVPDTYLGVPGADTASDIEAIADVGKTLSPYMSTSNRPERYTIKDNVTLYAVWEPVLELNFKLDRVLGTLNFEDSTGNVTGTPITTAKNLTAISPFNDRVVGTIIRPGEEGQYEINTFNEDLKIVTIFDEKVTRIYDDETALWYDNLNPVSDITEKGDKKIVEEQKHGLNRELTNNKDNVTVRNFHIPQYLGTDKTYDTSNIGESEYDVVVSISKPSYYWQVIMGKESEEVLIPGKVWVTTDIDKIASGPGGTPGDSGGTEGVDGTLSDLRTELRIRIK